MARRVITSWVLSALPQPAALAAALCLPGATLADAPGEFSATLEVIRNGKVMAGVMSEGLTAEGDATGLPPIAHEIRDRQPGKP